MQYFVDKTRLRRSFVNDMLTKATTIQSIKTHLTENNIYQNIFIRVFVCLFVLLEAPCFMLLLLRGGDFASGANNTYILIKSRQGDGSTRDGFEEGWKTCVANQLGYHFYFPLADY